MIARFSAGVEPEREHAREAFSEHLAQRGPRVRLGGALTDGQGVRTGILLVVESDSVESVRRFIDSSPYSLAGLYERVEIDCIDIEVGSLG